MLKNLFITFQLLVLCNTSPILAANANETDHKDQADQSEQVDLVDQSNHDDDDLKDTVTSMDAYSGMGEQTAVSLALSAKYAADQGDYDKAIKLCKSALKKDYDDMDLHMIYADALQNKIDSQKEPNQILLNTCVREWLIVFRTEVGDEKGLSYHGINPFGHFYEDEDRSIPARSHLVTLTGRAPKPWETDEKFMKWVNRPTTEVAGQLLSKKPNDSATMPSKIVNKATTSTN